MVEETFAGIGGDVDEEGVGEDGGAAGHGAAVAAGFADDGGGFAGDGGFVHGGCTFDDFTVAGDEFAGLHEDEVAFGELGGVDGFVGAVLAAAVRDELLAGGAEGAGLGLAAAFGDGFGEVGEDDGEDQPEGDLEDVAERVLGGEELLEREDGPDERDEHHGVFQLGARVEFFKGSDDRLAQDGAVKKRGGLSAHFEKLRVEG